MAAPENLNNDQFGYRMEHSAPDPESGFPAHDLTGMASDYYQNPHYYEYNDAGIERPVRKLLKGLKGSPDSELEVYRSVPPEHADKGISPGDWVTPSKSYAEEHGMHATDPSQDWPVISQTVKAKDIYTAGDSLAEWGWHPS